MCASSLLISVTHCTRCNYGVLRVRSWPNWNRLRGESRGTILFRDYCILGEYMFPRPFWTVNSIKHNERSVFSIYCSTKTVHKVSLNIQEVLYTRKPSKNWILRFGKPWSLLKVRDFSGRGMILWYCVLDLFHILKECPCTIALRVFKFRFLW